MKIRDFVRQLQVDRIAATFFFGGFFVGALAVVLSILIGTAIVGVLQ